MTSINENVKNILTDLPEGVELVAAAKTRTAQEILEAISAGVNIIGENYLQEAEDVIKEVGRRARWHFIGHLQKNKIKKAVGLFDMIESVDSLETAREIDKRCVSLGKVMPVLVEINSGQEKQKFGAFPEDAEPLIKAISSLSHIKIMGLMTMGPRTGNPEDARLYFKKTRQVFEKMSSLDMLNVEMRYLSMGMTNSYKIAIEEGANIVRIGTKIFGER